MAGIERDMFTGLGLEKIRNRNERKVRESMVRLFRTVSAEMLTDKDKSDVYALALNILPAAYAQQGTIVLGSLPDDQIDRAVLSAYDSVVSNPKS